MTHYSLCMIRQLVLGGLKIEIEISFSPTSFWLAKTLVRGILGSLFPTFDLLTPFNAGDESINHSTMVHHIECADIRASYRLKPHWGPPHESPVRPCGCIMRGKGTMIFHVDSDHPQLNKDAFFSRTISSHVSSLLTARILDEPDVPFAKIKLHS